MLDHGENDAERKKSKSKISKKGRKKIELADLKKELELVRTENYIREHVSYFLMFFPLLYHLIICNLFDRIGIRYPSKNVIGDLKQTLTR
jgi:hypothetical protein